MAYMGAIPSGNTQLQTGNTYTFIITLSGMPLVSDVKSHIMSTSLVQFFDIVNLTSGLGSSTYNLTVRMKKTVTYSLMVSLFRLQLSDWGFGESDFETGVVTAPSVFQEITAPITAPAAKIAETATAITSNIKWVVIGVAVLAGLFYIGPMLRPTSKKIGEVISK